MAQNKVEKFICGDCELRWEHDDLEFRQVHSSRFPSKTGCCPRCGEPVTPM